MANSLMIGCGKMGVNCTIIAPKELWPNEEMSDRAGSIPRPRGSVITITDDISAVKGADCVYTDVWCSMGEKRKPPREFLCFGLTR